MFGRMLEHPYFAHPINTYNTELERSLVKLIGDYLGVQEWAIENPNQSQHQVGYTQFAERARLADTSHKRMNYFYEMIIPHCDSCVALPFLDGRLGYGVAGEAQKCLRDGKPIFLIWLTRTPSADDLSEFRRNCRNGLFAICMLSDDEKTWLLTNDPRLVVPQEETRLRTWLTYQKKIRPFDESHLVKMPLPVDFYPDKE